jgi:D-alanyl-D-alanine carboxypeptidase (penicillin-binding protein 5/6)
MKIKKKIFLILMLIIISIQTISFADEVSITSRSAILVEVSTGRILYEKRSTEKMWPASTTKIMTAILVIENCKLDDMVTVTETAIENIPSGYVTCDLQVGEQISVKDLLNALMIKSANDAAYVLAEHVGGSIDEFSDMMNQKARELGCAGTHFVNPNGVHNESHYSTAYDLYLIATYAMKNETFRSLVIQTDNILPATNKYPNTDRTLKTTNALINPESEYYYKNAIGIKTGYTSQAGNCLVSEASRDGLEFIAVVLNGDRFSDSIKLLDYAYDNFTLTKVKEKNTVVDTIEIENATKETKMLDLLIDNSITVINNKSIDINQIIPEIKLREELVAPIKSGEEIGTIKYKVDDIEYSAKLLAASDVEEKTYYETILIIGTVLLIFALLLFVSKSKRRRKKRK